jgi:pectate lyase
MRIPLALIVAVVIATASITADDSQEGLRPDDLGWQVLESDDGWGAFSTGTTGGSLATHDHVFMVRNRAELVAALSLGSVPKIIYVRGTIDANVDVDNNPLTCTDYAEPGYTIEAYLAAYDPATWGRRAPTGTLENLRRASQQRQQARVRINIPSNTTLIGWGSNAEIVGAHVRVNNADNVIIRNITFIDAYDCFPAWDPLDGAQGNWNSQYDNISLTGATHVWVDHSEFHDGAHPDSAQPLYFGRPFQIHDGALDITNASDLVTVSWNRFIAHDKVMLIGSSDSAAADRGKLRVTIHHNMFDRTVQRGPRVRFGQVHVYNNLYVVDGTLGYAWGVGIESQIFAEENFFEIIGDVPIDRFISRFNGTAITANNTMVSRNGAAAALVDVVAEYNAVRDPDLSFTVPWSPSLHSDVSSARLARKMARAESGPFRKH